METTDRETPSFLPLPPSQREGDLCQTQLAKILLSLQILNIITTQFGFMSMEHKAIISSEEHKNATNGCSGADGVSCFDFAIGHLLVVLLATKKAALGSR